MKLLSALRVRSWTESAFLALLFLFPLAGMSVRHWWSTLFTLLALASLVLLFQQRARVSREERIVLWLFAALFGAFMLSNLVNGWGYPQTKALGVEIRFLFFVPLYLAMRRTPGSGRVMLMATVLSGFVLAGQAWHDEHVAGIVRAQGIYSPLIFGGYGALVIVFSVIGWTRLRTPLWRGLIVGSVLCSLYAVSVSGSRGDYLALVGLVVLLPLLFLPWRAAIVSVVVGIVLAGVVYQTSSIVSGRTDAAVNEVRHYLALKDPAAYQGRLTSSGTRLEMLRIGWIIFKGHPLLGVGSDNYAAHAARLAKEGKVHHDAGKYDHVHNVFGHFLATKGLLGTLLFIAILVYPGYLLMRDRRRSPATAALGMSLLIGFVLLSMTEAATFIKGNYLALFLVYLTGFLGWHMRETSAAHEARAQSRSGVAASPSRCNAM